MGLSASALAWFEAPPAASVTAAEELIVRLGAVSADKLTDLGRRMLRFPAHPRVARLICEAETRGVAREGCAIAALLGARELRVDRRTNQQSRVASSSDLIDDMDALADKRGIDRATAHAVDRATEQYRRLSIADTRAAGPRDADGVDRALQLAILTAFPDRVGRRRAPNSADIVFAGGGSGVLAPSSAVIDAQLVVAVDAAETGARGQAGKVQIRRASAIEADWLLDLYLDRVDERVELVWSKERVDRVAQMTYDGIAIDEQRSPAPASPEAAAVLAREAVAAIGKLVDADALAQWRARVATAAKVANKPGLVAPTDGALAGVIARACDGLTSFAQLRELGLLELLDASLAEHRGLVERLAPSHLQLPRRRVPIHYELDRPPWIASRMQDFFGLARAPAIGEGRIPLVLHLLAPNQRPVQVTTDLPGFWVKHYPGLRKQLMRRYPKHPWPEDPTSLIREE